jgi:hypothetical protein
MEEEDKGDINSFPIPPSRLSVETLAKMHDKVVDELDSLVVRTREYMYHLGEVKKYLLDMTAGSDGQKTDSMWYECDQLTYTILQEVLKDLLKDL